MYSKRSDHSHRRPSDRNSRQWDDYDDRKEERNESHRDASRDSFQKYRGDGRSSTEKLTKCGEYDDCAKRQFNKDSFNREWSRKSPLRRRMSSPVIDASARKRRRFTGDDDEYRYRHESQEKPYKLSPDSFSDEHRAKDVNYAPPHEDDYKYRKASPDSRYRHQREEFPYRKHDDSGTRGFLDCYKDRENHKWKPDTSQEKTRSPCRSPEIYEKTREWPDSFTTSVYREDYHQKRGKLPLSGQSSSQSGAAPERKSSKGFQRFLDVLNKGVNIDVLTKIVTQSSTQPDDGDTSGSKWSHGCTEWHQEPHQYEGSNRLSSPQSPRRSQSPNKHSASSERSVQRNDDRKGLISEIKSPSPVKITLTPEDEQKQRQMQNVLQAIGVDLGFEELGQMSHRIRERLYGKDVVSDQKASTEKVQRQTISARYQSRSSPSSSSKSSISPPTHDNYMKKDPCSAQRDVTDMHQTRAWQSTEYGQMIGSSCSQDGKQVKANPQKSAAAVEVFSPNSTYGASQLPPAPAMPVYSPINCSPLPYPAVPSAPPPNFLHIGPGLSLPCSPPFLPYPPVQHPNMCPPMLTQMTHSIPPPFNILQPQLFNQPNVDAVDLNRTQKAKPQARPRCLQVIK